MVAYLANQPTAGILICLITALILYTLATLYALTVRAWWSLLVSAGAAFTILAFLV